MTMVKDLVPGDAVWIEWSGGEATFVVATRHPLYAPPLRLVVWKMPDGSWSHDALDERQDVGQVVEPTDARAREDRLREALTPGSRRR